MRRHGSGADGDAGKKAPDRPAFPAESIEFFEARVRPILVDKCIKCHGAKKQSNGLRLDSREAALKGGDTGPAVVPGKPDESLLIQAVAQTHAELKMPPSGKLPDSGVAALKQWVTRGTLAGVPPRRVRTRGASLGAALRPRTGHFNRSSRRPRRVVKNRACVQAPRRCLRLGPARGRRA